MLIAFLPFLDIYHNVASKSMEKPQIYANGVAGDSMAVANGFSAVTGQKIALTPTGNAAPSAVSKKRGCC